MFSKNLKFVSQRVIAVKSEQAEKAFIVNFHYCFDIILKRYDD